MFQSYSLLLPAIPLMVLCFTLFYRTIARLNEDERARLIKCGRRSWSFITLAPTAALLLVPRLEIRLAAVLWLIPTLILSTLAHQRRLGEAGFDLAFMKHLRRLTLLSFVPTTLLVIFLALR